MTNKINILSNVLVDVQDDLTDLNCITNSQFDTMFGLDAEVGPVERLVHPDRVPNTIVIEDDDSFVIPNKNTKAKRERKSDRQPVKRQRMASSTNDTFNANIPSTSSNTSSTANSTSTAAEMNIKTLVEFTEKMSSTASNIKAYLTKEEASLLQREEGLQRRVATLDKLKERIKNLQKDVGVEESAILKIRGDIETDRENCIILKNHLCQMKENILNLF